MPTVYNATQGEVVTTPILLFECELPDGAIERWSTHALTAFGQQYEGKVLRYNAFDVKSAADDGVDAIPRLSVSLANVDSHFSEIERSVGFKGARVTTRLVMYDLTAGSAASDSQVVFSGVASAPSEITETEISLVFQNRLTAQRILLPQVRIQRRCPWMFPSNAEQRAQALGQGERGEYSPFFACGYSADQASGVGSLNGGQCFTTCDYTRRSCEQRGMFDRDEQGRATRRFGGIEFLPATILVKSHGESGYHASPVNSNAAKYNDFVPLVYGTAWLKPPVILARNDGNLTHIEALLGQGVAGKIHKVVVNGTEIPKAEQGKNMSATGWFKLVSTGTSAGGFNEVFRSSSGSYEGDPYGSMAVLAIAVPNSVDDGKSRENIQVLLDGASVPVLNDDLSHGAPIHSANPSWILLDLLQRSGVRASELDLNSFVAAASYCAEPLTSLDTEGRQVTIPRFACNLVLRARRSLSDVLRGIRKATGVYLRYDRSGRLQAAIEDVIAIQHPEQLDYSNAEEMLNGGWPAYEFGDGSNGFGDILRKPDGSPSIRFWSRGTSDTPNRFSVEFQDEFNEYQQDSLSLVDVEDVLRTDQEVAAVLPALGVPNFNQANRILRRTLSRSIYGNTFVEFETGLRGVGVQPGDIITLTYLKDGFDRQPFRVIRIAPGWNHESAQITAQLHDDAWYTESDTSASGAREPDVSGVPRPILGVQMDESGNSSFGFQESAATAEEEAPSTIQLDVEYLAPSKPTATFGPPLIGLNPQIEGDGALMAGQTLYYALTGVDADGNEGSLSFLVRCEIPTTAQNASVRLTGIRLPSTASACHVYRGHNPQQLARIASNIQVNSGEYVDDGSESGNGLAPDSRYDHANFYWRNEFLAESAVTAGTIDSVATEAVTLTPASLNGQTLRIVSGKGAGQERTIAANSEQQITVHPPFAVAPDQTSRFTVAESNWKLGCISKQSPAQLLIPNRQGAFIQVSGRSANAANRESAFELAPFGRWQIGGSTSDGDVPTAPTFALSTSGQGTLELSGVGFETLTNSSTVTSGTLTVIYADEVLDHPEFALASEITAEDSLMYIGEASLEPGTLLAVGAELVRVTGSAGSAVEVERGVAGSSAGAHLTGAAVLRLRRKAHVVAFPKGFFGSPASGSYAASFNLRSARLFAAEMFMTNTRGNSEATAVCYTALQNGGLRTLNGGQISMQVTGFLAIRDAAVPGVVADGAYPVRDVSARVASAPTEFPIELMLTVNGAPYCGLQIAPESTDSNVANGLTLPPLEKGDVIGLNIVSVGRTAASIPGRDLTVTIRL